MTVYSFRDDSMASSLPDDMCIHHLGLDVYFDVYFYFVYHYLDSESH